MLWAFAKFGKIFGGAVHDAARETVIDHDGVEHAGYLSFLGLLAIFPFLVFLVALAGFIGEGELGRRFIGYLRDTLPHDVVVALLPRIDEILSGPSEGLLTLSMLAALWTSSSAVEGYRTVLNRAYHVGTPPAYLWRRLLSIGQVLVFSFIIMAAMLLLVAFPLLMDAVQGWLHLASFSQEVMDAKINLRVVSGVAVLLLVAAMYYVLPNVKQRSAAVLPGAAMTVAFWLLAVEGLRFYLGTFSQVSVIYGSLGGVIVALLFFYVLNLIFIFGAEFNYHLLRRLGGGPVEEKQKTGAAGREEKQS